MYRKVKSKSSLEVSHSFFKRESTFISKDVRYIAALFLIGCVSVFLFSACNMSLTNPSLEFNKSSSTDNCRIFQSASGETCVPINLQKLVTLSLPTLANALILNLQPVGSTNLNNQEIAFPEYLKSKTKKVESLGGNAEPSVEKILLLKPDLILGWHRNNQRIYSLLSTIAPTLLYDWEGTPSWRDYFDFMAKVLGKEEAAEQAWKAYYNRIQDLKNALGDRYKDKKISFIYFCCDGFGSQALNSFSGSILEDVGLQRPEAQSVAAKYGEIRFLEEELVKADGDILFVAAYFKSDRAYFNQIKEKPLWKTLKSVQQSHVYIVDAETWRGGNLIAANAVIDDLYKHLVNMP